MNCRVESLFNIIDHHYHRGEHSLSYLYGKIATQIKNPFYTREASLFVENNKYVDMIKTKYEPHHWIKNVKGRFHIKSFFSTILSPFRSLIKYLLYRNRTIKYLKDFDHNHSRTTLNNNILRFKRLVQSIFYYSYYENPENFTDNEIILYPMHYEPEATISYFTEFYQQQDYLIANISKLLGKNQILFVKEHPQQPGILLDKKYRKLKKTTSNIFYLNSEFSPNKIILDSDCIVTQTSSMGWESLILNKKVVVFGNVFYDKHPAVYNFDGNWDKLRKKIRQLDILTPKDEDNIKFISYIWEYSQYGNPYIHDSLYEKSNINRLISSINKRVDQLNVNVISYE